MFLQRTVQKSVEISGLGLHTGQPTKLTFRPAPPNTGIYFVRKDMKGWPVIPVSAEFIKNTLQATTLGQGEAFVSTVEHCLSVLTAFRMDNLIIEVEGPEVPITDGSAEPFLRALLEAGIVEQDQPKKYTYIDQTIYYGDKNKYAYVTPYNGLRVTCTIDFPYSQIGKQTFDIDVNEYTFAKELSCARTFGFFRDMESMHSRGLALGSNLSNTVVLDSQGVMNLEGLRFADEFVRHKVLDALGDLATLGGHLMGHVVLYRSGHGVMNRFISKILDSPSHYRYLELGDRQVDEILESDPLLEFSA